MPYTPGGPYTVGGPFTNANANNIETIYTEATQSFGPDLFTPFVRSGFTAAKDGTTASQLDVAAGVAYPLQTDGTLRRRSLSSSTQSTVGHPSTTMYLFLNPDGTWAWQTSSTPPTNALAIAHCTTDASANILTVVDDRVLIPTILAGIGMQPITLPGGLIVNGVTGGIFSTAAGTSAMYSSTTRTILTSPLNGGVATGVVFRTWNGSASVDSFSLGGQFNSAPAWVDNGGGLHFDNGKITSDGSGNLSITGNLTLTGNYSGPAGGGIPTTRNGAALSVPIYTGSTTPVNPPTGSIWISA